MKAYLNEKKLEDYLGRKLVCREERQFALFLYLAFLEKKKGNSDPWITELVKFCLDEEEQDLIVEEVYYEATLMRDYFAGCEKGSGSEAEKFNQELLHFCLDFLPCDTEKGKCEKCGWERAKKCIEELTEDCGGRMDYHLGTKRIKDAVEKRYPNLRAMMKNETEGVSQLYEKACLDIARMMMNATPDLLVIYRIGEKRYAKALECKYQSEQGTYEDVIGVKIKMQYFIQECVMSFLFGKNEKLLEEKLPKKPKRGTLWRDENGPTARCEAFWENVYRGILDQEIASEGIGNQGVSEIKFFDEEDSGANGNRGEEKSKRIGIRELLKHMYT